MVNLSGEEHRFQSRADCSDCGGGSLVDFRCWQLLVISICSEECPSQEEEASVQEETEKGEAERRSSSSWRLSYKAGCIWF